jgi:cytochrome c oxidase subunit 7
MPIPPITGKLRKRFWLDLSCSLGLGISAGYTFWYGVHLRRVQRQEEYYLKLEQARQQGA